MECTTRTELTYNDVIFTTVLHTTNMTLLETNAAVPNLLPTIHETCIPTIQRESSPLFDDEDVDNAE